MIYTIYIDGDFQDDTSCLETLIRRMREFSGEDMHIKIDSPEHIPDHVIEFIKNTFGIILERYAYCSVILRDFSEPFITINAALRIYKDWENYFPPEMPNNYSVEDMIKFVIEDMINFYLQSEFSISFNGRRALMLEYLFKKKEYDSIFEKVNCGCDGIFSALESHPLPINSFRGLLFKYGDKEKLKLVKGI